MMSGMPLETCWAFSKSWNNKCYYRVASCWLFLLIWQHDVFPLSFAIFLCAMRCGILSWPVHSMCIGRYLMLAVSAVAPNRYKALPHTRMYSSDWYGKHLVRFTPVCFLKAQPCFSYILFVNGCPSAPYVCTLTVWAVFMAMSVCYLSFCKLRPHYFSLIELNDGFSQVVGLKCGYIYFKAELTLSCCLKKTRALTCSGMSAILTFKNRASYI